MVAVQSVWPQKWVEALAPFVILRFCAGGASIAHVVRTIEASGVAPGGGGATLAVMTHLQDQGLIRFLGEDMVEATPEGMRMLTQWDARWEQFVVLINAAVR